MYDPRILNFRLKAGSLSLPMVGKYVIRIALRFSLNEYSDILFSVTQYGTNANGDAGASALVWLSGGLDFLQPLLKWNVDILTKLFYQVASPDPVRCTMHFATSQFGEGSLSLTQCVFLRCSSPTPTDAPHQHQHQHQPKLHQHFTWAPTPTPTPTPTVHPQKPQLPLKQ